REATIVEEISSRFDDLRAHAQNRRLPLRPDPKVAMLHQKIGAMLFRRDRVWFGLRDLLQHLHVRNVEFVPAGGALIRADLSFNNDTRFLRQPFERVERLWRYRVFGDDALNHPTAVWKNGEKKLSALAQVVKPATNRDGLAVVLTNF